MARLSGKITLITGGAGGIGQAAARQFSSEGARVVLVDLDEAMLQSAVESIGEDMASYFVADVTQPDQVQSYVILTVERWDGIDIFLGECWSRRCALSNRGVPHKRIRSGHGSQRSGSGWDFDM